jgi:alkanesulfonate monooxygenase SsuD/methylene tetrahydromethanopterin reductase-like flavin-dependent oxidoreductase (luciferase family)
VGWNIVTASDAVAGLNFGMTEMPPSDLRYEIAAGLYSGRSRLGG